MKIKYLILLPFILLATTAGLAAKKQVIYSDSAVTATATSSAYQLNYPGARYYTMKLALTASNNSGTTPTADITVQSSPDCSHWSDVKAFTQVTTVASFQTYSLSDNATAFDRCWRVVSTLGGTNPSYNIKVELYHD